MANIIVNEKGSVEITNTKMEPFEEKLICCKCKAEMVLNVILNTSPQKYRYFCSSDDDTCDNVYTTITQYPRIVYKPVEPKPKYILNPIED